MADILFSSSTDVRIEREAFWLRRRLGRGVVVNEPSGEEFGLDLQVFMELNCM